MEIRTVEYRNLAKTKKNKSGRTRNQQTPDYHQHWNHTTQNFAPDFLTSQPDYNEPISPQYRRKRKYAAQQYKMRKTACVKGWQSNNSREKCREALRNSRLIAPGSNCIRCEVQNWQNETYKDTSVRGMTLALLDSNASKSTCTARVFNPRSRPPVLHWDQTPLVNSNQNFP